MTDNLSLRTPVANQP